MGLSVVVPLYNEADNVRPLVVRTIEALGRQPQEWELVLVDDGSSDGTWANIEKERAADGRVQGVHHILNQGQSAALWTGFGQSRGQIIATLDGDLQNDPADLPRMLELLRDWDMVCGVRTRRADSWLRNASSRVARLARRAALGVSFIDTGCNLRVFRRDVLDSLPPFNGLHRFMPVLAHHAGARVLEVPVLHHPRAAGVSKYGMWNRLGRGLCDLLMVALYMRRQFAVPWKRFKA